MSESEIVSCEGVDYPAHQASGDASRFVEAFAREFCRGSGYDVGCGSCRSRIPGALPWDPVVDARMDAGELPVGDVDFVFSSHCLEHLERPWVVLAHWWERVRVGGVVFLYLPHPGQRYWRPWNNHKHVSILHPEDVVAFFEAQGAERVWASQGFDLNHSFSVVARR